jgi:HSP20 family protein
VQREINNVFNNFFRGGTQDDGSLGLSMWTPAVDIVEREEDFTVNIELPGVNKEDVKITLENNVLTVRGEKKQKDEEKRKNYHRVERSYGSFQRSFTLPSIVRTDGVDASYKDGMLTIMLPKAEEAKAKQIEVRVK